MNLLKPSTWGRAEVAEEKATEYTLDQLIERLAAVQNTAAGVRVNPSTALKSPTVMAIVTRVAPVVASMPFRLLQDISTEKKREVKRLTDHNVYKLLARKPNRFQTPYEYWSLVVLRLLLWGRFYARMRRNTAGKLIDLIPIDPANVTTRLGETGRLYYDVTDAGPVGSGTFTSEQMHVITALSKDGIEPLVPVHEVAESIALEIAAEEFGATVFGSGAIPNVILKREGHFKDEDAAKRFAKSWNNAFNKRRGTAVLEDGMSFETVQMTNEDSQFLETRKFQRSVIAGAWGIPPHMVGDLERATFSNIEQLSLDFVNFAMGPRQTCMEQAVDRDMLSDDELLEDNVYSRFDSSELLRGDMKSRSESLQIQRQNGIINANEWRAVERMNSREDEGGDDYMTPLNFRLQDESGGGDGKGGAQVVIMQRIQ